MPITGMESTLKASLVSAIKAGIATNCGAAPMTPNCIDGLAEGIANAIIPFLTANVQVNPGIAVTIPSTSGPGAPSSGDTTAPGQIS